MTAPHRTFCPGNSGLIADSIGGNSRCAIQTWSRYQSGNRECIARRRAARFSLAVNRVGVKSDKPVDETAGESSGTNHRAFFRFGNAAKCRMYL